MDKKKEASVRTRRAIVNNLKQHGPQDAVSLASKLSLSGMAIRQHLYSLQEEGLVEFKEEARPMGRPAKMWGLTQEANKLFPRRYSDLTISLIESMKEAFGEDGLDKLLAVRNKKQLELYLDQMADEDDLREKMEKLSSIRTSEGYMAEVQELDDGSLLFIEKHCPICEAAAACTGLCQSEMDMFQTILGNDVGMERVEHLLTGGTRCIYKVTPGTSSR
ncbi:helix-turn-helix transcriptional regulator [Paenibacillus jiagnxiensis]|uniref:helix-turn-helix transcriptional regulator n=1 Tax=Paenibacillus jiagnxiensis TaxID=3228926 RepID=UPI0033B3DB36